MKIFGLKIPLHFTVLTGVAALVFFGFQNCSPTFHTLDQETLSEFSSLSSNCTTAGAACRTNFGSGICDSGLLSVTGESLYCKEDQCLPGSSIFGVAPGATKCVPSENFLSLTYFNSTRIVLNEIKSYPLLVLTSADEVLNPNASSLTMISGSCPAANTWARLNQSVSPIRLSANGPNINLEPGYNMFDFTTQLKNDLGGCFYRVCLKTNSGLSSCLTAEVIAPNRPPLPPPPTPLPPPPTPLPPPPTPLLPPPAPTCSGSAPATQTISKTCASIYGDTYSGNYTETTAYSCVGTTWTPSTSNNASLVCTTRQCSPTTRPSNRSTSQMCSALSSILTGNYTVTESYSCNLTNLTWELSKTDDSTTACQSSYTKLSSLQNINGTVEVPAGVNAYIDRSIDIRVLRINGRLVCGDETKTFKLLAESIWVNGVFECGSAADPYNGSLNIQLKRNAAIMPRTGYELNGSFGTTPSEIAAQQARLDENANLSLGFRALIVTGQIKFFGIGKGRVSRLTQTLQPGQSQITVDHATNWKVGDEIAIAPTGLTYQEDEKFKITAIAGNQISLNSAAQYLHFGQTPQTFRGQTKSFALDQRAEVVNLSRNIKIESHDHLADGTEMNQLNPEQSTSEPGGHVMIHGNGFAQIDAVEFYKLGQAGIMARYPFHWHRIGDTSGQFIKNSSIHKSFQRCVTVHATNGTLVENNVCYDFRGHGYFLEDGNEVNNTLIYNVAMAGKAPHANKMLLASDNPDPAKTTPFRFPGPSMYWISNPLNRVTDNIGVGMPGTVFWNTFEEGLGALKTTTLSTTAFDRNVAKSAFVGHNWDGAPANPKDWMDAATRDDYIQKNHARNPNNHADRNLENAHYKPNPPAVFNDLVATKLSQAAVYFRGNTVTFNQALLADNHWGFFLAYNQRVTNSVIVARSQSYIPNSLKAIGAVLYDGPFEFFNVDFYNFDAQGPNTLTINDPTPIPFYSIGGSDKVTNLVRSLRFIPNVQYKALLEKHVNDPWVDKFLSNSIRDLDGSFLGTAGAVIVPDSDVSAATNCTRQTPFGGFRVCPPGTRVGSMSVTSLKHGGFASVQFPYLIRKINKATGAYFESHTPQDIAMVGNNSGTFLNRKIHIAREENSFAYEVHVKKDMTGLSKVGDLDLTWFSEGDSSVSPMFKLVGYGGNCRLLGAPAYSSLSELNTAPGSGYYSHRSSFFYKINPAAVWGIVTDVNYSTAKPWVATHQVACDEDYNGDSDYVNYTNITNSTPPSGEIMGYIDGVGGDGTVFGWACIKGSSKQISIHVYANSAAGGPGAEFVGATFANTNSESAVAQACQDTSMTSHRFSFTPPGGFSGKKIYIHGINGFNNSTILNSGTFNFR